MILEDEKLLQQLLASTDLSILEMYFYFSRQFTSWFLRFYDLSNVPPLERASVGDRRGVLRPGEAQHGGGRVARLDDRADRRRRRGVPVRLNLH